MCRVVWISTNRTKDISFGTESVQHPIKKQITHSETHNTQQRHTLFCGVCYTHCGKLKTAEDFRFIVVVKVRHRHVEGCAGEHAAKQSRDTIQRFRVGLVVPVRIPTCTWSTVSKTFAIVSTSTNCDSLTSVQSLYVAKTKSATSSPKRGRSRPATRYPKVRWPSGQ